MTTRKAVLSSEVTDPSPQWIAGELGPREALLGSDGQ